MINNVIKLLVVIFLVCKFLNVVGKTQSLPDILSDESYQEFTFQTKSYKISINQNRIQDSKATLKKNFGEVHFLVKLQARILQRY